MPEFKKYREKRITEARPYILGEKLTGITVCEHDLPEEGGMIARDPENHNDMWYINPKYFEKHYEKIK